MAAAALATVISFDADGVAATLLAELVVLVDGIVAACAPSVGPVTSVPIPIAAVASANAAHCRSFLCVSVVFFSRMISDSPSNTAARTVFTACKSQASFCTTHCFDREKNSTLEHSLRTYFSPEGT